jgi:hypothetical protein
MGLFIEHPVNSNLLDRHLLWIRPIVNGFTAISHKFIYLQLLPNHTKIYATQHQSIWYIVVYYNIFISLCARTVNMSNSIPLKTRI